MKYKRQLVSGMLAISLLTAGTSAFAAETNVRPSKVPLHLNQLKMKSEGVNTTELKEKKNKPTRKNNKPEKKNKIKSTSTPII